MRMLSILLIDPLVRERAYSGPIRNHCQRFFLKLLLLLTALVPVAGFAAPQTVATEAGLQVKRIEARPFRSTSGDFGPDLLREGSDALGNIVTGAQASVSTLVVVEVEDVVAPSTGPAAAHRPYIPSDARVRLLAKAQTRKGTVRTLLDRSERVHGGGSGKAFVAFWLTDTGCEPLQLRATVSLRGQTHSRSETVGFTCFE